MRWLLLALWLVTLLAEYELFFVDSRTDKDTVAYLREVLPTLESQGLRLATVPEVLAAAGGL